MPSRKVLVSILGTIGGVDCKAVGNIETKPPFHSHAQRQRAEPEAAWTIRGVPGVLITYLHWQWSDG